ncbi:MAG TPA: hypothetical protein VGG27_00300 [Magnetospirillaceae bacterium]|jgi:TPR repeat protein
MRNLKRAAEAGDVNAQFNLGVMYDNRLDSNDRPVPGNRVEALHWLSQAAKQGLPRAQMRLAEFYAEEPDGPEQQVEACAWFIRALANTSGAHREQAQKGFTKLTATLTPVQIEDAGRMARLFEPQERHIFDEPKRRRAK